MTNNIIQCIRPYVAKMYSILFKKTVFNYFKTQFTKTVLISYITHPFNNKNKSSAHTNNVEVLEIAKVFRDLEYNVDVFNYDNIGPKNYSKYDIIFGFGDPLVNSFYRAKKKIQTIYYGTGMHIAHQNHATLNRIKDVYKKRNVWIPDSGRVVEKAWSAQTTLVDGMIVLGDNICADSYRRYYEGPIYKIPASFIKVCNGVDIVKCKDFSEAKKNFLWFGSSGLIHKGLDLVLEFFAKHPQYILHVCGPISKERKFCNVYGKELFNTPNIKTYDFVSITSTQFSNLMKTCAFIISPTCSEGGSPAVLNCIGNGGLIPIVSEFATIDIKHGITIDELSAIGVSVAVKKALLIEEDRLRELAEKNYKDVSSLHSIENYKKEMRKAINNILDK